MPRSVGKILFLIFIFLFSLRYYLECRKLTEVSENLTISYVFGILTLFLAYELVVQTRKAIQDKTLKNPFHAGTIKKVFQEKFIHLLLVLGIYIILIPVMGFFVTSFFIYCAISYLLGARSVTRIIAQGALVLLVTYSVFVIILNLSFPQGVLF